MKNTKSRKRIAHKGERISDIIFASYPHFQSVNREIVWPPRKFGSKDPQLKLIVNLDHGRKDLRRKRDIFKKYLGIREEENLKRG
jgi:hypothetical protein